MSSPLRIVLTRGHLAALALAVALVPVAAGPADADAKPRRQKTKRTVPKKVTPKRVAPKTATPAPAPAPAPAVNSVISIGGYVFYNLTLAEAFEAYTAAVAAAPAGTSPPPVTSVSVSTTVGSG